MRSGIDVFQGVRFGFLCIATPQQGDLRLSGHASGQGASGRARTRDRRVPADLRADSLATVPPTPLKMDLRPTARVGSCQFGGGDVSFTFCAWVNSTGYFVGNERFRFSKMLFTSIPLGLSKSPLTVIKSIDRDQFKAAVFQRIITLLTQQGYESALRFAGTLLSRVRTPPRAPWPEGGHKSIGVDWLYTKPNRD
ncbi:hypothetical protein PoB_001245300 [Plakobranchus ocellatus]|uniref:Uncharacterized protein n=1 Tax=Plakobranchus ocellatus TaxID=259542 RepID=A0AAV3YUC2_9GAST|nr:hypothetical protein PoB_001245300 [Plakobranchus ocellatus]